VLSSVKIGMRQGSILSPVYYMPTIFCYIAPTVTASDNLYYVLVNAN